ncbi:hypothetical protein [Methanolobus sp. WCC5]|uniref:hypothetical protein n=1 Tax=Methanolobus sp. WCC5 TaxID=3125785 RepID=UPI0032441BE5
MKERIDRIKFEIDQLIDRTGSEADRLAGNIRTSVKGIADEVRSIDLHEDVEKMNSSIGRLAVKTGDGARNLASDIGDQLDELAGKVNLGMDYDRVNSKVDSLIEVTGNEAANVTEDIMDVVKRIAVSVRTADMREEVDGISAKVRELARATGKEAEELATEIKGKIRDMGKKK